MGLMMVYRLEGYILRYSSAGFITLLVMVAFLLNACAGPRTDDDRQAKANGAIAGAVMGGLVGYSMVGSGSGKAVSTAVLGGVGAYIGTTLADQLQSWDRQALREATFQSMANAPTGEPTFWESEYTGNYGKIVPVRTYLDGVGRLCRDYKADIVVDGQTHAGIETACLTASGSWAIYPKNG